MSMIKGGGSHRFSYVSKDDYETVFQWYKQQFGEPTAIEKGAEWCIQKGNKVDEYYVSVLTQEQRDFYQKDIEDGPEEYKTFIFHSNQTFLESSYPSILLMQLALFLFFLFYYWVMSHFFSRPLLVGTPIILIAIIGFRIWLDKS